MSEPTTIWTTSSTIQGNLDLARNFDPYGGVGLLIRMR
jgi:hypothetical protein